MSAYEAQANKFLADFGLALKAARVNKKRPAWVKGDEEHGDHYRVTIKRHDGPSITFDFWGSINDRKSGREISPYDVLACISSDLYCPDDFRDFCSEYGYDEDSRTALATFDRASAFAKKLRDFFSDREQERLSEIH